MDEKSYKCFETYHLKPSPQPRWTTTLLPTTIAGLFGDFITSPDIVKLFPDASKQALARHRAVILAETRYQYDSSVFPVRHDRYGVPSAPRLPHWAVGPSGGEIIEIPPLTVRLLGMNLPVGGGGYLRLLPVHLVIHALNKAEKNGQPGMIYVHPWELDADQPTLQMSRVNRWRHRVNLGRTAEKLSRLLARFTFLSVRQIMDALASCDIESHLYGSPDSR